MHFWYTAYKPPAGATVPQHLLDEVPVYDVPFRKPDGNFDLTLLDAQDIMAWTTQGPIARRDLEKLGWTDRGVILLRKIVAREIDNVAAGRDPMGVIRDPAKNEKIDIPLERNKHHFTDGFERMIRKNHAQFSPIAEQLIAVFSKGAQPVPA
jgi:5,5'-dehydrodivanillate O-demethylase